NTVCEGYAINYPPLQILEETGHKGGWVRNGTIQAVIRQNNRLPRSLDPARKDSLKMRTLLFAGNHTNVNVAKTVLLKKLVQMHFAKPEPVVRIKLTRLIEAMTQQIE